MHVHNYEITLRQVSNNCSSIHTCNDSHADEKLAGWRKGCTSSHNLLLKINGGLVA